MSDPAVRIEPSAPHVLPEGSAAVAKTSTVGDGSPRLEQRTIAVCVDDFGLNAGVNAAALQLAEMRRVSALSAMTQAPEWEEGAARARHLDVRHVDVGLHFNLTLPFNGAPALGSVQMLIAAAHLRLLPKRRIREALLDQLDAFEEEMFRAPTHLDSHEHVHHLPEIRDIVLDVLVRRYAGSLPWVRVSAASTSSLMDVVQRPDGRKAWLIDCLVGAEDFRRRARSLGFLANRRLLGVYDFKATESEYGSLLRHWLRRARDGDLLMCHPGSPRMGDLIRQGRAVEFMVWADPGLPSLLRSLGIRIAPMSGIGARASERMP